MAQPNIDQLTQDALEHYLFPLAKKDEMRSDGPMIFVGAEGVEITDAAGKTYLDMMSTHTRASSLGYGDERIAKAIYEQLLALHYAGTVGNLADVTVRLAAKIAELAPGDLSVTSFGSSGSEANEMAFKAAKQYHHFKGDKPRAFKIISRWLAYHGATMGALAATDYLGTRHITEPGVPGYSHIPAPTCYRCPFGLEYPGCGVACAKHLEAHIQHEGPEYVAAFIAEPVMQADGVQVPPREYFQIVRQICDRYGVLFIADEVITGFGRTGAWFAMSHWDIDADIMSTGKAMTSGYFPLAATTVSKEIADTLPVFVHVQTYQGHPGGAAAALETIEIVESEDLITRARDNGAYFLDALKTLETLPIVGQVRGLGMWTCIDFTADKKTRAPFADDTVKTIVRRMQELGVLGGEEGAAIEFAPSYTASRAQLDTCVEIAGQAIREVTKERNLA
jgi:adenosylmethionine-8-amino-7-oxononanoate aminotransferase